MSQGITDGMWREKAEACVGDNDGVFEPRAIVENVASALIRADIVAREDCAQFLERRAEEYLTEAVFNVGNEGKARALKSAAATLRKSGPEFPPQDSGNR